MLITDNTGGVRDDRERLLARYQRSHRPADLERLVLSYRPLARALARRYGASSEIREDLDQVACEGLIKAIQRFDPQRGTAFTAFAVPTILGELRRYFRDTVWPAHVPRTVQERARAARVAATELAVEQRRTATVTELADRLGWTAEQVLEALEAASLTVVSFDGSAPDDNAASPAAGLGAEDAGFERVECLSAIEQALPALTDRQRNVLRLRFEQDWSRNQIASRLGVSRSAVGRELDAALARLRSAALTPAA